VSEIVNMRLNFNYFIPTVRFSLSKWASYSKFDVNRKVEILLYASFSDFQLYHKAA
jgi:hypothetical protein